MSVVTISREAGSGGDEVARRVCELLNYRYFDKELLAQVAQQEGIAESEVVDFSEDSYRMRSFIDAVLGRSASISTAGIWTATARGEETKVVASVNEETAAHFVDSTIRALRQRGQIVVVGRGGQVILRGEPGVLHVRIVAGREDRVPRLMQTEGLSRVAANDRMAERDRTTAQYMSRFHGVDGADPLLYHLVLNTSLLGQEAAAQLIVAAVKHMEAPQGGV